MKLKDSPVWNGPVLSNGLSSRDIRAVTASFARPDDPLAGWRIEFDEWRKANGEQQQLEQARLFQAAPPSAVTLRQHRYLLFLLMARGEELALALMEVSGLAEAERNRLIEQVDAYVGCLADSWHTWHGEALPEHRAALAKFLA